MTQLSKVRNSGAVLCKQLYIDSSLVAIYCLLLFKIVTQNQGSDFPTLCYLDILNILLNPAGPRFRCYRFKCVCRQVLQRKYILQSRIRISEPCFNGRRSRVSVQLASKIDSQVYLRTSFPLSSLRTPFSSCSSPAIYTIAGGLHIFIMQLFAAVERLAEYP